MLRVFGISLCKSLNKIFALSTALLRWGLPVKQKAVLSSITHIFSRYFTMSDLESDLESNHAVKINRSEVF